MTVSKELRLKRRPESVPTLEDFELAETRLLSPEKGEFQVRNLFMSVDPYMRNRMYEGPSYIAPFEVGKNYGEARITVPELRCQCT